MNLLPKALITTVALLGAASASAAVITFGGTATPNDGLTTSVAGATVVDFNDGTKPIGYTGAGSVQQGSVQGSYAAPTGDATKYLSVGYSVSSGTETAIMGGQYNYFGIYWGSIDGYNKLSFYDGDALLMSLTGADLLAAGADSGDQIAWGSSRYVNFAFGDYSYDRVVFQTTAHSFESDNHAYGLTAVSVPEPGTLGLLGLSLLGAGIARRRKSKGVI